MARKKRNHYNSDATLAKAVGWDSNPRVPIKTKDMLRRMTVTNPKGK